MSGLGTFIVASLFSIGTGLVWVAALGLASGCGDNEGTGPDAGLSITITESCQSLGCDSNGATPATGGTGDVPSCDGTGFCTCDAEVCEVPACGDVSPVCRVAPSGSPNHFEDCNGTLCYCEGVLCDQAKCSHSG